MYLSALKYALTLLTVASAEARRTQTRVGFGVLGHAQPIILTWI